MEIHSSISSSEELMHYGRKGMKWYQNIFSKDKTGSGKKRRGDEDNGEDPDSKSKGSGSSAPAKKSAKDMSEAELMSAIRHLQLEKQYRDLEAQQAAELNPPKVSKGKEFVSDFIKKSAVPALQEAGRSVLKDWLVKVGKEAMGLKEEGDSLGALEKEVKKLRLDKEKTEINEYLNKKKSGKKTAEEEEKEYIDNLAKDVKKMNLEKQKKKLEEEMSSDSGSSSAKKDTSSAETKSEKSSKQSSKEADDAVNYFYNGGPGQKKAESGKSFTDDYVERVKATVEKDTRSAKEKYDQSTGPIYTMDFTKPTVSLGQSFTNQFLLEDKSR